MSEFIKARREEIRFTSGLFAGSNTDQIYPSLKAIANPFRLQILCYISQKEACVTDIVTKLGTTQSNVSQHLRILKDSGVIDARKVDNFSFYRIISPTICQIIGSNSQVKLL